MRINAAKRSAGRLDPIDILVPKGLERHRVDWRSDPLILRVILSEKSATFRDDAPSRRLAKMARYIEGFDGGPESAWRRDLLVISTAR
jgi:hypothetical protein